MGLGKGYELVWEKEVQMGVGIEVRICVMERATDVCGGKGYGCVWWKGVCGGKGY